MWHLVTVPLVLIAFTLGYRIGNDRARRYWEPRYRAAVSLLIASTRKGDLRWARKAVPRAVKAARAAEEAAKEDLIESND